MKHAWLMGIMAVCLAATVAQGRPGTVKTRDGQTYQGDVTEKDSSTIIINRNGIETVLQRDDVQTLSYNADQDAEFQQRFSKLAPRDMAGRLALAHWAFDVRRYDLAAKVLEDALHVDPNSREATDFLESVRRQSQLESRPAGAAENPGTGAVRPPGTPGGGTVAVERKLLTAADINVIREAELRPTDDRVRVALPSRESIDRFIRANKLDPQQFLLLPPFQQALQIIQQGDAKIKEELKVQGDPSSMHEFRTSMVRNIQSTCATIGCHGGNKAGDFVLYAGNDEATAYTNFYILQKYNKTIASAASGSVFGGAAVRKMIDRTNPEESLLLQYGLPQDAAQVPHPNVNAFRALFAGKSDVRYKQFAAWMGKSLSPIDPNYTIKYDLPHGTGTGSATGPAATTRP